MVVMIHTGMLADYGTVGQSITNAGKYGVQIFFVISGFTIAKTFSEAKNYTTYLTRRIMRIVPLYWLIITLAMVLWVSGMFSMPYWMQELGSQPDLYNYLMHLTMISYLDYRVANSILGVEWSIPIEVFWYICLPPLIYFGKTIPRAISMILALLVLTALLSLVAKKILGTSQPIKWSPIAHGHLFFMGVISYYLRDRFQSVTSCRPAVLALSTAILIVCVTPARATWVTRPLTARPMLFLGSISYSIYLIHALVIHILGDASMLPVSGIGRFMVVYGITIVLSAGTYLLVEIPTNQAGRRMVEGAR